jgi:excisionase family DNA binding protein
MGKKLAFTIDETAAALGVSPSTVKRQIKAGAIPAVRYGRTVRVPAHALERSLDQLAGAS